jgi:hypothetical protein
MPQRFEANIFSPGATKLMQEAFGAAWGKAISGIFTSRATMAKMVR